MIDKIHFGRIINFFINIFLGIALVFMGLFLANNLNVSVFCMNFVVSMGVGYIICDLIPAPIWGERIASKIGIKNKIALHIVSTIIAGTVLITCISFFCQFSVFGYGMLPIWKHSLPYLLIVGYVVLIVFLPICKKIAQVLTK